FRATNNPGDDTIAMHGRAGVLSRDEKIGLARFFIAEKGVASLMYAQRSGHEIGCIRLDVSVFPNSSDFALFFQVAERAAHLISSCRAVTERVCHFNFVERPIFRIANESEDFSAQTLIRRFPFACHADATWCRSQFCSSAIFWRPRCR